MIDIDALRQATIAGMRCGNCPIEDYGLIVRAYGTRGVEAVIPPLRLQSHEHRVQIAYASSQADAEKAILRNLRSWWSSRLYLDAVLAAGRFLTGKGDAHPYMIERSVVRLLETRGMTLADFRRHLRREVGNGWGGDGALQASMDTVRQTAFDMDFEYRWRSGTRTLGSAFDGLGPMQFRMAGNGGWGLWLYTNLAPGVFWKGGPAPALWVDRIFPEAAMTSAKGRAMTDVVEHDALDVPGLKVASMRFDGKRTVIQMTAPKVDAGALADEQERAAALRLAA